MRAAGGVRSKPGVDAAKKLNLLATAGAAALLAPQVRPRPASGQAAVRGVPRSVPASHLSVLDPILTTTYNTRNHG